MDAAPSPMKPAFLQKALYNTITYEPKGALLRGNMDVTPARAALLEVRRITQ